MSERYDYHVAVVSVDGEYEASLDDGPIRARGASPILAIAALADAAREWPMPGGGADRWLRTPAGVTLARQFCPTFEPDGGEGMSS